MALAVRLQVWISPPETMLLYIVLATKTRRGFVASAGARAPDISLNYRLPTFESTQISFGLSGVEGSLGRSLAPPTGRLANLGFWLRWFCTQGTPIAPGMIIHQLIAHHLKHKDDAYFYQLQADDAVRWIEQSGVPLGPGTRALDLGCGHGVFGSRLAKRACPVTFADERNLLLPELATAPFRQINLDRDDIATLGQFDLVVCSNVFEHLSKPDQFLESVHKILSPGGKLYLSWTNWLSPWGGHDFSPLHYFGPRNGQWLYDKFLKRHRNHTIYQNLFPT